MAGDECPRVRVQIKRDSENKVMVLSCPGEHVLNKGKVNIQCLFSDLSGSKVGDMQ